MSGQRTRKAMGVVVVGFAVTLSAGSVATADDDSQRRPIKIAEKLSGYQEDPVALSTTGTGRFRASINAAGDTITYQLTYSSLEGNVSQAHIHFGGRAQSGGVAAFLCSNVGGPAGTQACPAAPATVTGTIQAADVVGPAVQGIAAGELAELIKAIRAGVAYVNVHSSLYPGGEIRGQLDGHAHD